MEKSAKVVGAVVGRRIRRLRRWQDLSQRHLAYLAEMHRTQISLIEGGERIPRIDTLIKLAGGMLLSPCELLDGIVWEPRTRDRPGRMVEREPDRDA